MTMSAMCSWKRCGVLSALAIVLPIALGFAACGEQETPADETAQAAAETASGAEADDVIERTSESGPVSATVTVEPSEPTLGDPIVLTLSVEAEPGIEVQLPAFGEALGRFAIVDFTPRQELRPDGGYSASQRYTLQPPMSGRQRIPPLRVAFEDHRPDTPADERDVEHEILTDEIAIQVASVLPEDADSQSLREAHGALPLRLPAAASSSPWLWVALGAVVVALAIVAFVLGRRAMAVRRRRTAYDIAMASLALLRGRGLPKPEEADAWYVDLSGIVRRYLENRFGLRAPELTTEEFLREARRSAELTSRHRSMLSEFLAHCDQVKFAGYRPSVSESIEAIDEAEQFVEETRLRDETPVTPTETASAPAS